jgi:predicted lipoprotein with Yx(FWY)xxD motif
MKRSSELGSTMRPALTAALTLGAAALLIPPAVQAAGSRLASTTPPGITLVEVMRDLPISEPQVLWLRPGDADGRTLFVYEQDGAGKSNCTGSCALEFPPLIAAAGAKPSMDWSLVRRSDGKLQWAYQSHPLYSWVKETVPGEVATNVGLVETANAKTAEVPVTAGSLLPPKGWQVGRFNPAASLSLPDGFDARPVDAAQSVALVDVSGRTLYTFAGDARHDGQDCAGNGCSLQWQPVAAPALALALGEFSVVKRADGSQQWAYKGRPLYVYPGDKLPGDANGLGVDPRWSVAAVSENFHPAHVSVALFNGYGAALTLDGMTLYGGYPFEKRWGGRNLRDTFTNQYARGKRLGAAACLDGCLKSWHPLLAPADATSNGLWEAVARPDGTRQWAYKGYALYTYAGDKAPGDHNGQAIYDFAKTEGDASDLKRTAFFADIAKADAGAGIYWNIAKP